jgi:hypothetical protein
LIATCLAVRAAMFSGRGVAEIAARASDQIEAIADVESGLRRVLGAFDGSPPGRESSSRPASRGALLRSVRSAGPARRT